MKEFCIDAVDYTVRQAAAGNWLVDVDVPFEGVETYSGGNSYAEALEMVIEIAARLAR